MKRSASFGLVLRALSFLLVSDTGILTKDVK